MEALKWFPLLNTIIMIAAAIVMILRLEEAIKRFERRLERNEDSTDAMDKRLVMIETVCRIHHKGAD